MFTGIVQTIGFVDAIKTIGSNIELTIKSKISHQLKIDQSVAHNGVCLTVIKANKSKHTVVAIAETLAKTTIASWKKGQEINLELAMSLSSLLDGHIVQGHVDQTAICTKIEHKNGSTNFWFKLQDPKFRIVPQGSIAIDGTSLTVSNINKHQFCVSIIPYTLEYTIFKNYTIGTSVNIEFDIIGKYIERYLQFYSKK